MNDLQKLKKYIRSGDEAGFEGGGEGLPATGVFDCVATCKPRHASGEGCRPVGLSQSGAKSIHAAGERRAGFTGIRVTLFQHRLQSFAQTSLARNSNARFTFQMKAP